jgi:hypothetical protein
MYIITTAGSTGGRVLVCGWLFHHCLLPAGLVEALLGLVILAVLPGFDPSIILPGSNLKCAIILKVAPFMFKFSSGGNFFTLENSYYRYNKKVNARN